MSTIRYFVVRNAWANIVAKRPAKYVPYVAKNINAYGKARFIALSNAQPKQCVARNVALISSNGNAFGLLVLFVAKNFGDINPMLNGLRIPLVLVIVMANWRLKSYCLIPTKAILAGRKKQRNACASG